MLRRAFLGSVGVAAAGGTVGLLKNSGDVNDTVQDAKELAGGTVKVTHDDGTTEFGLLSGGFEKVSWHENGDLLINFADDPEMAEWGLVSPEPERNLLASGTPAEFGGTKRANLRGNYPLSPGEYLLIGAKLSKSDDNWMGVESERTGKVTFSVKPNIVLESAKPAENPAYAELTLKNTGTAPVPVKGAKITGVPHDDYRYEFFEEGETFLLPSETTKVRSRKPVFATDSCPKHPDRINVSLYTADSQIWNQTINLQPSEKNPSC